MIKACDFVLYCNLKCIVLDTHFIERIFLSVIYISLDSRNGRTQYTVLFHLSTEQGRQCDKFCCN